MGMAASQARYLSLAARKSNIEYQGQQINNERTILSQQCTDLYNSLLSMNVPTPPSTQDFTKIVYSGVDGVCNFTLGAIKPSGENYNVEIQQESVGRAIQSNYGSSLVVKSAKTLQGKYIDPSVYTYSRQEQSKGDSDTYVNFEGFLKGSSLNDIKNKKETGSINDPYLTQLQKDIETATKNLENRVALDQAIINVKTASSNLVKYAKQEIAAQDTAIAKLAFPTGISVIEGNSGHATAYCGNASNASACSLSWADSGVSTIGNMKDFQTWLGFDASHKVDTPSGVNLNLSFEQLDKILWSEQKRVQKVSNYSNLSAKHTDCVTNYSNMKSSSSVVHAGIDASSVANMKSNAESFKTAAAAFKNLGLSGFNTTIGNGYDKALNSLNTTEIDNCKEALGDVEGTASDLKLELTNARNKYETALNNISTDVEDYLAYDPATGRITSFSGSSFDDNVWYIKKLSKEEYNNMFNNDNADLGIIRETCDPKSISKDDLSLFYVQKSDGTVEQLNSTSPYVTKNTDGTYSLNEDSSVQFFMKSSNKYDTDVIDNPDAGKITIQGKEAFTYEQAKNKYGNEFDWNKYEEAIRNTYGTTLGSINKDDFYVFVDTSDTGVRTLQFALATDVYSPDGYAKTYSFTPNGKYNSSTCIDQCKLNFDVSGRILSIDIPALDSKTGEIISYNTISLSATKVVDDNAYQDAYAQYEYAMYEYDKKNAEINAKTEIIQQEDKNLELKLQRLDNERDAIDKEMDALDKVIGDNIEKTFKTFAG